MSQRADLSAREVECLAAYAETGLIKEAAYQLGLSEQTVKNYLRDAYRKLGVDRSIEAFTRLGWLRVPEEVLWPR